MLFQTHFFPGFHFSYEESTALLQCEGGPCAVLAPVQAFLIKTLLETASTDEWRNVSPDVGILFTSFF